MTHHKPYIISEQLHVQDSVYILRLYGDTGKENGNYNVIIGYIFGLYRDNGKEDGKYYNKDSIGVI